MGGGIVQEKEFSEEPKIIRDLQYYQNLQRAFLMEPEGRIKEKYLKTCLASANVLYTQRKMKKAVALYHYVLEFDQNNHVAITVLNRIYTKYAHLL